MFKKLLSFKAFTVVISVLILIVLIGIQTELSELNSRLNCVAFQNISMIKNIGCQLRDIESTLDKVEKNTDGIEQNTSGF